LEVSVAAAMLAALLATSVQAVALLRAQQQSAEHRALAVDAVQNLLEQFENLPWEQATAAGADRLSLPDSVGQYLHAAKIAVTVVDESEPITARRATVELAWQANAGRPAIAVRMTTWIFPESAASR
jgi:hypothetical protein